MTQRLWRKSFAALLCTVTFLALTPTGAAASYAHIYSIAYDTGSQVGNNWYSGISVVRYDNLFTLDYVSGQQCGLYIAPIAYQTMWAVMADASRWVEFGTAHQNCDINGTKFEFKWWYAWVSDGTSREVWRQDISGVYQHRFFLTNGSDGYWRWYIDVTQMYQYYWLNLAASVSAGLESYDTDTLAPSHTYSAIVKQINWSGWTNWTINTTRVDSGMSGTQSNQDWVASEP